MSCLSESLRHDLYACRETDGKGGTAPVRLGTLDGKPLPDDFAERLRLAIVPIGYLSWIPGFIRHLREFRDQFGHVNVRATYVSPDGYPLGSKVHSVRNRYCDAHPSRETEDMARWREVRGLLDDDLIPLGFRWDTIGDWIPEFIDRLKEYATEYGHANPPTLYVTPDGYKLGQQARYARQYIGGTDQEIGRTVQHREAVEALRRELDALGFSWLRKRRVMPEALVTECRRRYRAGEKIADIARALGINKGTVQGVVSGRNRRHVPDEASRKRTVAGTRSNPPARYPGEKS
jgi:hypothetical protein